METQQNMIPHSRVFCPTMLGNLTLRNPIVRAGCFEGLCQDGMVTEALIEHHRRVAAGGVGMTTVAYCSVSFDGRAFGHEMWMRPEILPGLSKLTKAVHAEGAAASIQLGHCGFFANPSVIQRQPLGASPQSCLFRLSFCTKMTEADIQEKTSNFVQAAILARDSGFDAIEIHAGHGYLLSQFLSPFTNHRHDHYGGSLENRLRFPLQVIRSVRAALGDGYPIIIKMNQRDGMPGGLELSEAVQIAQTFEDAGTTALVPSAGFTASTPLYMMRGGVPTLDMARAQDGWLYRLGLILFGWMMVQKYPYQPLYQLDGARKIKDAVNIPVGLIGGVTRMDEIDSALGEGFGFVEIGRATIRDPNFVVHLQSGEIDHSDCDHCNRCIASMSVEGVKCASLEKGLLV